jgi:UDP-N-acetylglucosamine 2-epimerase (non-hydrolysing)
VNRSFSEVEQSDRNQVDSRGERRSRSRAGSDTDGHTSANVAVVYVVGARPNFVKMAPVIREMRRRAPGMSHVVVHTGQHYDRELSEVFFEDLGLPAPDHLLKIGSGSHGAQTGRALERIENVLAAVRPRIVVVPGDVNSTLAAGLAAAKLGIDVAHLEAGLRSFDRTMPEEVNRVLVDQLSRWCFIHSPEAELNLLDEGIEADRVWFVGNTMIDTLVRVRPRIAHSSVHERLDVEKEKYLLVTLHRPALVDGAELFAVLEQLGRVAQAMPVVFPMHPRTRARLAGSVSAMQGLRIVDPVGYVDFLALEASAAGVLTDSGGVQEETTFLGVRCFTLRDNTERPVTLTEGTNRLLGLRPELIGHIPHWLAQPPAKSHAPAGWDGNAARRVTDVLLRTLQGGVTSGRDPRNYALSAERGG